MDAEEVKRKGLTSFGQWLLKNGHGIRCTAHDRIEDMSDDELIKYGDLWNRFEANK